MALTIDESDPCDAASKLRQIYLSLVSGQAVSEVHFKAGPNGVERRVRYASANLDGLLRLIRGFEEQCTALTGCRPRRFGLSTGGRF